MKQTALVFDIDGVICDSSKRFKRLNLNAYNRRDKNAFIKSLQWYQADCRGDKVIKEGVELLSALIEHYFPTKVFFITARGEGGYSPTLGWLKKETPWNENFELIMHPETLDDEFEFKSPQIHADWKKNTTSKIMENYDILFAVDDSEDNIKAYNSLNIPVLKFAAPNLGRVLV